MYDLVFEHDDFLVLSKHQGACVHCEPDQIGVIAQLKQDFGCESLLPVHRLDKVTSGLLICAKNHAAASELSQLFQHRQIEKYYLALSDQKPKKKQGLICGDMERARRGSWKLCHTKLNPAVTQFFSYGLGGGQRLFLLKPKTGKTHQIRVALKSIGSPIVGDRLYGHPQVMPLGICLHAYALQFTYQAQPYSFVDTPKAWMREGQQEVFIECLQKGMLQFNHRPWELPWPIV